MDDSLVVQKRFAWQKQVHSDVDFPLVLTPTRDIMFDELQSWLNVNREYVAALIAKHGCVLFRGFKCVSSAVEFNDFVEQLGMEALPYVGGAAPRTNVYKGVHTSNESPPSEPIPFHHEMAQVPVYPSHIFFYCPQPAQSGGATPVLRSDVLCERLRAEIPQWIEQLEERGVQYTRVLPAEDDPSSAIGRSWPSTFHTTDQAEAEVKARDLGVELQWQPDGTVKSVSGKLAAIKQYDGRKVFFNSLVAAYTGWRDKRNDPVKAVTYATGQPLEPEYIEKTQHVMEDVCVDLAWEQFDVAAIDNNLVMHARRHFVPPRRVLAYVAK